MYDFRLGIPDTTYAPSNVVQIPLRVTSNGIGFSSVQLVLNYNTNTFMKLTSVVSAGTLTDGFTFASSYGVGTARIAAAGVSPVNAGGTLMLLTFQVPDSTPISSFTSLTITSVTFNEGSPRPLLQNGSLQIGSRPIIQVVPLSAALVASVGFKDSVELTVNNLGNLSLVSSISVVGSSAFTVSLSNINVSPGGTVKPKIYYQPNSPGPDSAKIQFNTNDPYHSVVNVSVIGSNIPLNIELSLFNAIAIGSDVELHWRTETEINNFGFEIECRVVGNLTQEWKTVGFVQGSGTSNSRQDYAYKDRALSFGRYAYRIKQIDNDGYFKYYGNVEVDVLSPRSFLLEQNYPNPFNPSTILIYNLPVRSQVRLTVYNLIGQIITRLVDQEQETGYHQQAWNAGNLSAGIYIYRLEAVSLTEPAQHIDFVRKMILMK